MLLAEIKGKSVADLEGIEDLITSSVFGHLRLVPPSRFWVDLFGRAKSAADRPQSLASSLQRNGIELETYDRLQVRFWPYFTAHGEPDLLLHFSGREHESTFVLIEVKLNSGKSGLVEQDQLAKYMRLLDDDTCFDDWPLQPHSRNLVYLTRAFSSEALCDSAAQSFQPNAASRMFGLEWNDVLEVCEAHRWENFLLGEVSDFLKKRGLDKFSGFHFEPLTEYPSGLFYGVLYFVDGYIPEISLMKGSFYEQ